MRENCQQVGKSEGEWFWGETDETWRDRWNKRCAELVKLWKIIKIYLVAVELTFSPKITRKPNSISQFWHLSSVLDSSCFLFHFTKRLISFLSTKMHLKFIRVCCHISPSDWARCPSLRHQTMQLKRKNDKFTDFCLHRFAHARFVPV